MPQSQTKIALVIGAAGQVGGVAAAALSRHGWKVRALARRARPADPQIEWVEGDATNPADVRRAAEGAAVIVHGAHPAGYRGWDTVGMTMLENTIAAAKAVGARIVFPGNLYNFGPDAFPALSESSPQNPTTRKGAIRVDMERRLRAAAASGAPVLILRAGDFFGPGTTAASYFSAVMVQPGKPVVRIIDPARRGVSHAWAYLPDFGETIAQLLDRGSDLPDFAVFHFAGHQLAAGEMATAIAEATGKKRLPVWRFPWWLVVLAQPAVRLFREMAEMRYLWREPISVVGRKLAAFLGKALPATPLDTAVRDTLASVGCLPKAQSRESGSR
jgi:nucleoside-diphosphate-sugar epimerase